MIACGVAVAVSAAGDSHAHLVTRSPFLKNPWMMRGRYLNADSW
jgi:hypothetical protein